MAPKWSNLNLAGALHYVTANVAHRISVFRSDECCQAFLDEFKRLLKDWPCRVVAYVLMPDHIHFIVNPEDGRIKEFTGALKSLTAKSIVEIAP